MEAQISLLNKLEQILTLKSIISISGKSGTGKTSLALYLITQMMLSLDSSCIWIQASEPFPLKRLRSMLSSDADRIEQSIFIIPEKTCLSYNEQRKTIRKIFNDETSLPPNLRFIVVDNISHHLRHKVSKTEDIKITSASFNDFYDAQLLPLIFFCLRNDIILILIHEMSYSPKMDAEVRFLNRLYEKMDEAHVLLIKNVESPNEMKIFLDDNSACIPFQLGPNGFLF